MFENPIIFETTLVIFFNLLWQIGILAFIALGLAIVFGMLGIMNMAHGEFVMIGAYAPVIAHLYGLPPLVAFPLAFIIGGTLALILEITVIRHFYGRLFDSLLVTWGIAILIREAVELLFGRGFQGVSPYLEGTVQFGTFSYPIYRLTVIVFLLLFFIALAFWLNRSAFALRLKALVSNPELAQATGINTTYLARMSFTFAGGISSLAGCMIAPTIQVNPLMGLDYLITSFFAIVVGGAGSLLGLGLGSSLIAGSQLIFSFFANQAVGFIAMLLIAMLILWKKPHGLGSHS